MKEEKDDKMSLSRAYFIRYVLTGVMWIFHGIIKVMGISSIWWLLVSRFCMVFAIVFILASLILPHDRQDDVTKNDFRAACTYTLGIMMFVLMALAMLSEFVPSNPLPFQMVYPFIIGGGLLLLGVIFVIIEKS